MASATLQNSPMILLLAMAFFCFIPSPAESARAFFVFGDSLVDNGNNNYLATTARADAPPYGIDYPTHRPTGRFSNGFNIPDFISQELGSEPTLPYLSPELNGEKLLIGANFASAGIGILNDTGIQFVNVIRMFRQLDYFQEYQDKLIALIGPEQAKTVVNEALVLVTSGGNDFVNNYYLVPYSTRSRQYALPDYVNYVVAEYKKVLTEACCGQGPHNGIGLCTILSNVCANRDQYVFWDPFHPTERANSLLVQQMMTGSSKYMNPMNLSTILALDSKI